VIGRVVRADEEYPLPPAPASTPPDVALFDDLPVLRGLLRISQAVSRANYFDEVLEVIADEACATLHAASLSISRWERDAGILRTLINVGDLGPGEVRWPQDECYTIADDRHTMQLLQYGHSYVSSVDDPDAHPAATALLRRLGKTVEMAVPIMHDDVMWGELWATGAGTSRFSAEDVQLLKAVAAQTSVAIGRTELFSTVWRHAHQDPLTGAANRRAMEAYFATVDWSVARPVVMVCDIDGFKVINDTSGHPAGDAVLCMVADVLRHAACAIDGAMVSRLGGDEFCVLLPHASLLDAERFTLDVAEHIRTGARPDLTLGWGAAPWTGIGEWPEQVEAADAALLMAKHTGTGQFGTAPSRPRSRAGGRRALDHLVPNVVGWLAERGPVDGGAALSILAAELSRAIGSVDWSVDAVPFSTDDRSGTAEHDIAPTLDGGCLLTIRIGDGRLRHVARLVIDCEPHELAAFDPYVRVLARYCATFY
jgi:diguanylate cyclase (GGDEF)-like protein